MKTFPTLSYEDVLAGLQGSGTAIGAVNPTEYHSWKKKLAAALGCPVVSKSSLCDFMESAYRFRWNEEHEVKKEGKGLRIGSMVDTLVLTPDLWGKLYTKPWEPSEPKKLKLKKDGTPYSNGAQDPAQKERWDAEAAEFAARCEQEGITILKDGEEEEMREIAAQATAHAAKKGLVLGKTFVSQIGMFAYLEELGGERLATPIIVTGMIDILPDAGCEEGWSIWDLKTTSADTEQAQKLIFSMEDFHYGIQAALYLDLYNMLTGAERREFAFLFVGNAMPAMSRVMRFGEADVEIARREYQTALHRLARAHAFADWGTATLEDAWYVPTKAKLKEGY